MARSAHVAVAFIALALLGASDAANVRSGSSSLLSAREQELEASWSQELDRSGVSPIKRVVELLMGMKKQLEGEASKESDMYDEMSCWCKTNDKDKTQSIADADAKMSELETGIQEKAARKGELSTQITKLKKDIESTDASLKTATAIREKALAEFTDVETDMIQTITNLKNAIAILGRHQGGDASLLQLDTPMGATIQEVLRDVALKYELLVGRASPLSFSSQKQSGAALLDVSKHALHKQLLEALGSDSVQGELPLDIAQRRLAESAKDTKPATAFMQAKQPIFKSYAVRSSGIYGILTQMLEEFEANLSQEQKDELNAQNGHQELSESQTALLDTSKEKLDELEEEHSAVVKALSDHNEDLDLTAEQRSADVEFLRNLRLKCQDLDGQFEERSKTRTEELAAVSEALAILTADDAKDLFVKSVPSFLQEQAQVHGSVSEAMRRSRVVASLRQAAKKPIFDDDSFLSSLANSWRQKHASSGSSATARGPKSQLATLAVSAQLDSFTKVKEAMDKMVAELKDQQKDEVAEKAFCRKELDENEKDIYAKNSHKEELENKIASLTATIETLTKEIEVATKEIADSKVAIKKASETREKANSEFQTTVTEQRATQAILKKALARLADFYKKEALLQRSAGAAKEDPEPPVKFNAYKTNKNASPTMNLLEQIIGDSKTLETEAITGEQKEQESYESFVQDSNRIIEDLSNLIIEKKKATADAEESKETAKADLGDTEGELESLGEYKGDLHTRCDWLLKNFDTRQKARMEEMEAIQSAKAILSGSGAA